MTAAAPRPRSSGLATDQAPPLDLPFRFIATSLAWLALLAVVYPWHTPLLLGSFYAPHLTTFVHVNTLGLIASTIMGASYQLLPVVLQEPIASVRLGRLSWWLYVPGLLSFVLGLTTAREIFLGLGGILLFSAVGLYVFVVVATLRRARDRDVVYWHIAVAVAGLATAATLGLLLALSKFEGFLGGRTLPILASHVTLMLGGWVTPMLAGVAYRLVGMFTLSEDRLKVRWAWAELALTAGGAWLLAGGLFFDLPRPVLVLGADALFAGVLVFAAQLTRLYRLRRRRTFDVHMPFAGASVAFGLTALGLVLFGLLDGRGAGDPVWVAAGWLAIAGWAETAIQGFLYKIGTFLTWLNRYAPLAGRQPVPRLEELYGKTTALVGWSAWVVGVALAAAAALSGSVLVAEAGAAGLSVGAAAFLVNAVRVGLHWRSAPSRGRSPHASQPARP